MENNNEEVRVPACSRRTFVSAAAIVGTVLSAGALAGCADAATSAKPSVSPRATSMREGAASSATSDAAAGVPAMATAVVCFSQPPADAQERDAGSGASVVMSGQDVLGNVQFVAQFVAQATGGDLLRIETQEPYPTNEDIFDYALAE